MIISRDPEKAFNKIQHLFMIKALMKLGMERMFLSIIKVIANIIINDEKVTPFPITQE
jgi:hypothetical protein